MPQPRRLPSVQRADWPELRRRASTVFLLLQAGWAALDDREREQVRALVAKSRGNPRRLTKDEARQLGRLAGKAATAAAATRRR